MGRAPVRQAGFELSFFGVFTQRSPGYYSCIVNICYRRKIIAIQGLNLNIWLLFCAY